MWPIHPHSPTEAPRKRRSGFSATRQPSRHPIRCGPVVQLTVAVIATRYPPDGYSRNRLTGQLQVDLIDAISKSALRETNAVEFTTTKEVGLTLQSRAALRKFGLDPHPFRLHKVSSQLDHIAGVGIAFCSCLALTRGIR